MNEEYRFLESIAYFLQQGYLIQDILEICSFIYSNERIEDLKKKLNNGLTLDEAIIKGDFNRTFINLPYFIDYLFNDVFIVYHLCLTTLNNAAFCRICH